MPWRAWGAGGGEVLLEGVLGCVPDDPEFLGLGRAFAGPAPGPARTALIRQPPAERERPRDLPGVAVLP
uniref:Uncharacterized protein n=1 Tax=Streptomyces sp. NBC_00049 TaxID=2903617 RepID=A0AAU2JI71_9ACTN